MAEALGIFGSVASVISIIDVLARASSTVLELRSQWNDADLILMQLTSQLAALRAALIKIKEWMAIDTTEVHHELVIDLDTSLQCCKILVGRIEVEARKLAKKPDGSLRRSSKGKFLLKGKGLSDIQSMIDRQTSTLNLLLTACNSKALSEQQSVIREPSTRDALMNVRKDSASLIVHCDASSSRSSITDNLSKLSIVFEFDRELFASRVYQSFLRNPVKLAFRTPQVQAPSNKNTSRPLGDGTKSDIAKILITGIGDSSTIALYHHFQRLYGEYSQINKKQYRKHVLRHVFESLETFLQAIISEQRSRFEIPNPEEMSKLDLAERALREIPPAVYRERSLSIKLVLALRSLMSLPMKEAEVNNSRSGNLNYFLHELDRLSVSNFVPTREDILHAGIGITPSYNGIVNIDKTRFEVFEQRLPFDDENDVFFGNWLVLLYIVPMGICNQPEEMKACFAKFREIVNCPWYANIEVILCFTEMDLFRINLNSGFSLVNESFPDFDGNITDITAVQNFISAKFAQLYPMDTQRLVWPLVIHYLDVTNTEDIKNLAGTLQHIVDCLRDGSRNWTLNRPICSHSVPRFILESPDGRERKVHALRPLAIGPPFLLNATLVASETTKINN